MRHRILAMFQLLEQENRGYVPISAFGKDAREDLLQLQREDILYLTKCHEPSRWNRDTLIRDQHRGYLGFVSRGGKYRA